MMLSRTRFGLRNCERKSEFYVRAIGDRLLTQEGKIVYLLFMDVDASFRGLPDGIEAKIFNTRNGFHAIGLTIVTLKEKIAWFKAWHEKYPESDYPLRSFCWLCPHTREEALYVSELALKANPYDIPLSEYYRDKRVFEVLP